MHKILQKLASAGTVALLGYEVGTHTQEHAVSTPIHVPTEEKDNHISEILIISLVIIILLLIAVLVKIFFKKPTRV